MTDEEVIAQLQEITGIKVRTCELCGLPLPEHDRVTAAEVTDREAMQHLCAACLALQARNEDPLPEADEEDYTI